MEDEARIVRLMYGIGEKLFLSRFILSCLDNVLRSYTLVAGLFAYSFKLSDTFQPSSSLVLTSCRFLLTE